MLKNHRNGFTLIELLVVIAIIAILAAILFPVFAQAREKARQTTCLSNAKQSGLALVMYAQDFDETFPRAYGPEAIAPLSWGPWFAAIYPYTKSIPLSDNDRNTFLYCPSHQFNAPVGFSANAIALGRYSETTSQAEVSFPADLILVSDGNYQSNGGTPSDWVNSDDLQRARASWYGDVSSDDAIGTVLFYAYNILPWDMTLFSADGCSTTIGGPFTGGDWLCKGPGFRHSRIPGNTNPDFINNNADNGSRGFATCIFADGHAKALQSRSLKLRNVFPREAAFNAACAADATLPGCR